MENGPIAKKTFKNTFWVYLIAAVATVVLSNVIGAVIPSLSSGISLLIAAVLCFWIAEKMIRSKLAKLSR